MEGFDVLWVLARSRRHGANDCRARGDDIAVEHRPIHLILRVILERLERTDVTFH
jgi:hypothetical protein